MGGLATELATYEASLSPEDRAALTTMERQAMVAETRNLLLNAKARQKESTMKTAGTTPPNTPPGSTNDQTLAPPGELPPPVAAAPAPAAPPPAPAPPAAAPPTPPPGETPPVVNAAAGGGIEQYIDEKQNDDRALSTDEMGIKDRIAANTAAYGHLRVRATKETNLEVFDPNQNGRGILLVRPNLSTKKDAKKLHRCATELLATIGCYGLTHTARIWRGRLRTAEGVVDFGVTNYAGSPHPNDHPSEGAAKGGDDTMRDRAYAENAKPTTSEVTTNAAETPELRTPVAAAKTAQNAPISATDNKGVSQDSGALDGRVTTMSDEVHKKPEGDGLSVLADPADNMRDEREPKDKGSDSMLDDAVNTFANETLTASRKAQTFGGTPATPEGGATPPVTAQAPPKEELPPTPPAPDAGVVTDPVEKKFAQLYAARAEQTIRQATHNFVARFARCMRMAARRQALNLEQNMLKVGMAEALMTSAPINQQEKFVPLDSRTAVFVIERGLGQRTAMDYIDALFRRTAEFMKVSDQALAQMEQDLDQVQPVEPGTEEPPFPAEAAGPTGDSDPVTTPAAMPTMPQMAADESPPEPGADALPPPPTDDMEPPLDEEIPPPPPARQARLSARAGNLPINPTMARTAATTSQSDARREAVRSALSGTKGSILHGILGR